jgi:hypothetical protein
MKTLTLQITRPSFVAILKGEQKVEHRYIYVGNASRYIDIEEVTDENGDTYDKLVPIQYGALKLINGRRKDAPRLIVEVEEAEIVRIVDEEGRQMTYEEKGVKYNVYQVWYHLGKVISSENCEKLV